MKTKHIISAFILAFLCIGTANAQITSSTQRALLTDSDRAIVEQRVSRHTAFTIDKKELTDYFRRRGGEGQFRLQIDESLDWTINLKLNDLRTPDFRITYTTAEGEFECEEPFVVNTFHGRTSTGLPVAFTIDENTFFGVILGENYHYMIRSANDYTQNRADRRLIVYHSWDIIADENYSHFIHDAIRDALHAPKEDLEEWMEQNNVLNSPNNCGLILRVATDADFEFFQQTRNGSTLSANTNNYIRSVINAVGAIYQAQIPNLRVAISFQHVYTSGSNQPYTTSNAIHLLENQFRHHWRTASNRINVVRNVVHLFTGKNLFVSTWDPWGNPVSRPALGVAWGYDQELLPNGEFGIGNDLGYAISSNHARLTAIVAHEIGHNLTATHPLDLATFNACSCNNTNTATIMCPSLTNSNNLHFCRFSLNQMNYYMNTVRLQLLDICGPNALCNFNNTAKFEIKDFPYGATLKWTVGFGLTIHGVDDEPSVTVINLATPSLINSRVMVEIYDDLGVLVNTLHHNLIINPPSVSISVPSVIPVGSTLAISISPQSPASVAWFVPQGHAAIHPNNSPTASITAYAAGPCTIEVFASNACGTATGIRHVVLIHHTPPLWSCGFCLPPHTPPCTHCTQLDVICAACPFPHNPPCAFCPQDDCEDCPICPNCERPNCWLHCEQEVEEPFYWSCDPPHDQGCPECTRQEGFGINFIVFPNPVNDELVIDFEMNQKAQTSVINRTANISIVLYDNLGFVLRRSRFSHRFSDGKLTPVRFSVSNLPEGTYYLHVHDGMNKHPQMHQIVVQR